MDRMDRIGERLGIHSKCQALAVYATARVGERNI